MSEDKSVTLAQQQSLDPIQDEPAFDQGLSESSEKDYTDPSSPTSEASKENYHEGRFFDRLNAIPLVAEGMGFVTKYADDDKAYSKYVKYALGKAEVGFHTVTEIAEAKFPTQVTAADQIAANTLEYLEEKFPGVLKQTTSEVYKSSRQAISDIVASPHAALNSTIDTIANNAEVILDRYLPADSSEKDDSKDVGVARLRHVGVDASRRITQVVRTQIGNFSNSASSESILNLSDSNKFFQRAAEEVASLNEKLKKALSATKDNVSSIKEDTLLYLQKSQSHLVSRVTSEIDSVAKYLKENAADLPEGLRKQLEPTINFFGERYSKVTEELQKSDHSPTMKARNTLLLATESIPFIEDACVFFASFLNGNEEQTPKN